MGTVPSLGRRNILARDKINPKQTRSMRFSYSIFSNFSLSFTVVTYRALYCIFQRVDKSDVAIDSYSATLLQHRENV
jgi:hypothetical protein